MSSGARKPEYGVLADAEKPGNSGHAREMGLGYLGDESSDNESDDGRPAQAPVCAQGTAHYIQVTVSELLLGSRMNVLLLAMPFSFCSHRLQWGDAPTFIFSLLALIPFAERVSFVTEDFAKYTSDTVGGLLNATFGNITELVVCIFALRDGLLRVVQVSMLGSVLSNLLLVLGSAFLVGGLRHHEQKFNKVAAVTNSGLLIIAVLALSLPGILDATHHGTASHIDVVVNKSRSVEISTELHQVEAYVNRSDHRDSWASGRGTLNDEALQGGDAPLWLSRFIAGVMLVLYAMLIYFQLETHSHLFEDEDGDDDEPGILGFWGGFFWLSVITAFISVLSNNIVDTIEGAAARLGVPILFLSGILVPIVGNAAEHAAAVIFAWRNKMEIALGSAVGSAVQISVFVIPLCVMLGWLFGQPMTLNCHIFETVVLLLTCMAVAFVLMDGKSHWLKGAMLIFAYIMIAAAFWAHADPENMS